MSLTLSVTSDRVTDMHSFRKKPVPIYSREHTTDLTTVAIN